MIVCTQCRRTFESLDFISTLMVYCSSLTNGKVDTNDTNLLSLHWTNKISFNGSYFIKYSPKCHLFFKHIISVFHPFLMVLMVPHANMLYQTMMVRCICCPCTLLDSCLDHYPIVLLLIEFTTTFWVVWRSNISVGIKTFFRTFTFVYINMNDEVVSTGSICQFQKNYLIFVWLAVGVLSHAA